MDTCYFQKSLVAFVGFMRSTTWEFLAFGAKLGLKMDAKFQNVYKQVSDIIYEFSSALFWYLEAVKIQDNTEMQ